MYFLKVRTENFPIITSFHPRIAREKSVNHSHLWARNLRTKNRKAKAAEGAEWNSINHTIVRCSQKKCSQLERVCVCMLEALHMFYVLIPL